MCFSCCRSRNGLNRKVNPWDHVCWQILRQNPGLANNLSQDQPSPGSRTKSLPVMTPQQVENKAMSDGSLAIMDWTSSAPVQVLVQKTSAQLAFSPHPLYLVIGRPEKVGRWITELTVEHGARNIVLATHGFPAEQGWVKHMHSAGVNLRTIVMYVLSLPQNTNKKWITLEANHILKVVVILLQVPQNTRYTKSSMRNWKW